MRSRAAVPDREAPRSSCARLGSVAAGASRDRAARNLREYEQGVSVTNRRVGRESQSLPAGLGVVGFVPVRQVAALLESHGDLLSWVELRGVCRGSQRLLVRRQQLAR